MIQLLLHNRLQNLYLRDAHLISLESTVLMLDGCTSLEEITIGEDNGKSAIKGNTFAELVNGEVVSAGIKSNGTLYYPDSLPANDRNNWYLPIYFMFHWQEADMWW